MGLSELKEQLEMLEGGGISIMQIAKQARNERDQKLVQIFKQEENEVYIASLARWDAQLKGLVELERCCQDLMQEVKLRSVSQEVLAGLVEDKSRMQSEATERYCETIFEEMEELEEKRSKETLVLVQKKHILSRCESGRERTRMLQRLGGSTEIRHWIGLRGTMSVESCSSSMACSESSRKMKDMEETTSEASWTTVTRRERNIAVEEPEGEAVKLEAIGLRSEVKGVSVNPQGESRHRHARAKMARKERENQTRMEKKVNGKTTLETRVRRFKVRKEK